MYTTLGSKMTNENGITITGCEGEEMKLVISVIYGGAGTGEDLRFKAMSSSQEPHLTNQRGSTEMDAVNLQAGLPRPISFLCNTTIGNSFHGWELPP